MCTSSCSDIHSMRARSKKGGWHIKSCVVIHTDRSNSLDGVKECANLHGELHILSVLQRGSMPLKKRKVGYEGCNFNKRGAPRRDAIQQRLKGVITGPP